MKRFFTASFITLPLVVICFMLSKPASATEIVIGGSNFGNSRDLLVVQPSRHKTHRVWVPGHYEYQHHQRHWVPGHYEYN